MDTSFGFEAWLLQDLANNRALALNRTNESKAKFDQQLENWKHRKRSGSQEPPPAPPVQWVVNESRFREWYVRTKTDPSQLDRPYYEEYSYFDFLPYPLPPDILQWAAPPAPKNDAEPVGKPNRAFGRGVFEFVGTPERWSNGQEWTDPWTDMEYVLVRLKDNPFYSGQVVYAWELKGVGRIPPEARF